MASEDSDRLLIQQIRANGPDTDAALMTLLGRYEGRIRSYVRNRLRDTAAIDDVVQETFIGFCNSLANFDDKRKVETWLFTIASHKLTDYLRKLGRKAETVGGDGPDDPFDNRQDHRIRRPSSVARSHEQRQHEEEVLARALKELLQRYTQNGDYRRVMVLELLFVKGVPNREVAQLIGVTDQQVANYRFDAVRRLGEAMQLARLSPDLFPELAESN